MIDPHDLTGCYAVHALDPAERTDFEAHLADCEACQSEVAEFTAIAAELALLSLAAPPATLRTSILDAVRTGLEPRARDHGTRTTAPAPTNGTRPAEPPFPAARAIQPRRAAPGWTLPSEPEAEVDELALRRQRRRIRVLGGLVAALLALAVGLGGVVYTLVQERQAQTAQTALEEQLYAAPDATTVTVPMADGGQATFIASKQLDRALFIGTDLPDPGPDNRYQLWTGAGDPTAENGITGLARDNQVPNTGPGAKVFLGGDVATADFLAVNLEPAGSTPEAPTNPVLAAGVL
jgi:anti-sigma factor RsiW